MVCLALADGDDLPGSTSTPGHGNAKAVVGASNPEDHSGAALGLFSIVTLFAHRRMTRSMQAVRQAAWYRKSRPTFSDALALIRKELWAHGNFRGSPADTDMVKVPRGFVEHLTETLCYAA